MYYSTWSFENVAKICQFQFFDTHTHTNNFLGVTKKFLAPPHTLVNISWNLALSVLQFWGGIKVFRTPPPHTHTSFSLFQILNIILDQFVDCKLCIVMYYKFTVQKLVQNYI